MAFRTASIIYVLLYALSIHAQDSTDQFIRIIDRSTHFYPSYQFPRSFNLINKEFRTQGQGMDTAYYLPDRFVVWESEIVYAGGVRLTRNVDYSIRYRFGEIQFNFLVASDVELYVQYQVLPFNLNKTYYHRKIDRGVFTANSNSRDTVRTIIQMNDVQDNLFGSAQLNGSGSITRGFTIGSNQDFQLNSGLNVQLSGNISEDVTLEASLTDENTPIQPEGNTEKLQEIDKVFVEVKKGDRYAATFGDINVNYSGWEFGRYSRRLEGVKGSMRLPNVESDFALASTRGKYATNTIAVQEGVQGPYELVGKNRERNILIVAGTEKVWLNGVLLVRGDDNDYVVDYSSGQLTFTRKRLITGESRIVVDFEYSDDQFNRNSYSAGVKTTWFDKRVRFSGIFINEYDDKNHPINLSLSQEIIDSLSQINDDSLAQFKNIIYVSGATPVEFGKGSYRKTFEATFAESIFVFVGVDNLGDYNVRFTDFGDLQGDYERGSVLGEYRFVGKNMGNFLPLVSLSLPTQTQLAAFSFEVQPTQTFRIRSELALSKLDRNTFSPNEINGKAFELNPIVEKQKLGLGKHALGEFDLMGRWRHKDSTFNEIDRVDDAEFDRNWNLPSSLNATQNNRQEDLRDILARYRPSEKLQFSSFYGRLERGESSNFTRYGAGSVLKSGGHSFIDYRFENIESHFPTHLVSSAKRHYVFSQYQLWKTTTGFDYESEKIGNTVFADSLYGTSYQVYRPKIDVTGFAKNKFGAMFEWRYDVSRNSRIDSLDGRVALAATQKYYYRLEDFHNLSSTIEWIRREKTFQGPFKNASNLDKKTNLVNASADYYPLMRAVMLNMNYQLSDERLQGRKVVFIPVQTNGGNFAQVTPDSFQQVPQGLGNYIQGSVRSPNFTPIVNLKFGLRFRFEPIRLNSDSGSFWKTVSSETFLQIEESQTNPSRSFYFVNWSEFQKMQRTVTGSAFFRQDVFYSRPEAQFSIRARYELQKNLSNALVDGFERRKREIENVRVRKQISESWSVENEGEYESNRKASNIPLSGINGNFNIYKWAARPLISYKPTFSLEWRNEWRAVFSKEKLSQRNAKIVAYAPELIYSFRNRGRADFNIELIKVYVNPGAIPFELTDGNKRGVTSRWSFVFEYRIGESVTFSFNYSGRKDPGADVVHIGGAEFRAFF